MSLWKNLVIGLNDKDEKMWELNRLREKWYDPRIYNNLNIYLFQFTDSIKRLEQVAQHMNEMIRQHENSCKLIEISTWLGKNYHGTLVEPGRYFIKGDTVLKVSQSMRVLSKYFSVCSTYLYCF